MALWVIAVLRFLLNKVEPELTDLRCKITKGSTFASEWMLKSFYYVFFSMSTLRKKMWLVLKQSPHTTRRGKIHIFTIKLCNFTFLMQWGNLHSDKKIPDRSRFFEENFDGFSSFSQKVCKIQKSYIPLWKALISSSLEQERLGVWLLKQSSHAHLNETWSFFTQRGVVDLLEEPRPISLTLQRAGY